MKWNKKDDVLALMVGHGTMTNGKWDPGAAYGKYTEAALMLPIVKVAVKKLRQSGVRVLTDADKGNNRNMISSVAWANKNKCKLYMSVHCDYKDATPGVAPLYKTSAGKEFTTTVGKKVAKLMDMKWKGAFKRTDLHELNATDMPAVIFETGAIKADLKYLKDYKKYGRSLAKAICAYLGVKYYVKPKSQKLADMAKKLAYGTAAKAKAKYPSGSPTPEYKKALNKVFPDRKKWGPAPRKGASCDVFIGTVVRSSGVDKKFPRALGTDYSYLEASKKFKKVKVTKVKDLKDGDIIIYKRTNGKGHICMFVGGKIKHAAYNKWYPRTQKCAAKMLDTKGKKFVRVYRAK